MNEHDTLPLDLNLESMLISAERYAFGRRTYIVSMAVGYLIPLLPRLSNWCIGVMYQDLSDEQARAIRIGKWDYWGDPCDRADWMKLLDALGKEKEWRAKHEDHDQQSV